MARPLHIVIAGPVATSDVESLLDTRGPWPQGYGGAPLMGTLIRELLRRGHRVSAVTLSADMPLRPSSRENARITAFGQGFSLTWCPMRPKAWPPNRTARGWWMPGRIVDVYRYERRQLRNAIQALQPDIVHAHWAYEFAAAAQASGLPHLITCHDVPSEVVSELPSMRHKAYRWLRARLARRVMRRARALTAPSPWLSSVLAGQSPVPIVVVPNPLPPSAFESDGHAARARAAAAGRRRVLSVCNGFNERKNLTRGLRAFALLAQQMPGAELVLLGDQMGPEDVAQRWWREQGLAGNVRFVGPVTPAVVRHWMMQSDVLLHPALSETFGMVVAEAMAAGLPVVASREGGALPWLLGDAGVLVDVTEPKAMADGLAAVLAEPQALAGRLGAGLASLQALCAAPTVAEAFERLYRAVLAGEAGKARPVRTRRTAGH